MASARRRCWRVPRRGRFAGLATLAATGLAAPGPVLIGESGARQKAKKVKLGLDGQTIKVSKR